MAELTRKQHDDLGDAFNPTAYFGGYVTALGGLYNAAVDSVNADDPNYHREAVINMLHAIAQRFTAVFKIYIKKDDGDAADEFSVTAGKIDLGGIIVTFAGEIAVGPLTADTLNYIWLDLSAALSATPAITVEIGTAWPSAMVPHMKLGTIDQPATGSWSMSDLTPYTHVQAARPSTSAQIIRKAFTFESTSPIDLSTVAADARVKSCTVVVDTAFDGTAPTFKLGDGVDDDRLMTTAATNLKVADSYTKTSFHKYASETELVGVLVIDGSTVGAGEIILEVY